MIEPGDTLRRLMGVLYDSLEPLRIPYWLGFGGLWGIVMNDGVVPDNDFDLCAFYGGDWRRLVKALEQSSGRYTCYKKMLDDANPSQAVYLSFDSPILPHICFSLWYPHNGINYFCHDGLREVNGEAPASEYHFKGVPDTLLEYTRLVEWPGIDQRFKVRVPRFPGSMLDYCYPDWAYKKQRYNITKNRVEKDKMKSYHKGGAISPYVVIVKSMAQWRDEKYINQQLKEGRRKWNNLLKTR